MAHKRIANSNKKTAAKIDRNGAENLLPPPAAPNPPPPPPPPPLSKPNLTAKALNALVFFLTITSLVALFSCKKKEEPAPTVEGLLTGKAWQLTSSSHSNGALQGIEKYQEDDYLVFYSNGTCAFITGEDQTPDSTSTMANPEVKIPEKQTDKASTWLLSDDNKIFTTLFRGIRNSQIVITNYKLVLAQARSRGGLSSSYNDSEISIQTLKPKEGGVPVVHTVGLEGRYRYESY